MSEKDCVVPRPDSCLLPACCASFLPSQPSNRDRGNEWTQCEAKWEKMLDSGGRDRGGSWQSLLISAPRQQPAILPRKWKAPIKQRFIYRHELPGVCHLSSASTRRHSLESRVSLSRRRMSFNANCVPRWRFGDRAGVPKGQRHNYNS